MALAEPRRYLTALSAFRDQSSNLAHQAPLSHMPNLCGLIRSLGGSEVIVVIASMAVLLVASIGGKNLTATGQFGTAITVAALTSYYMFIHDLSVIVIPLAILIGAGALNFAAVGFVAPALMVFAPDHFYLAMIGPASLLLYFLMSKAAPVPQCIASSGPTDRDTRGF
jgi:hypothetical protein